ncbi:winged helix-turn-helix domain-containing protein, partial [Klebsiella pneumoniae]|uniref:winged helix-turn-helix domain-containing protein n=1 Tax=Klebsiella pneumoniae TaxID=573 RepID=UPI0025A23B8C
TYDGMDRSVDVAISRLRKKLLDNATEPYRIKTVRNKGYLFAPPMLAENHTHSVPRADDDWRSFLIGNARSFRQALLAYRDGARI